MKTSWITVLFLAALAAGFSAPPAAAQGYVDISIGDFYDELSPYGDWVDCSYGDCWVPSRVDSDWQPYSNGEWIYTDYGWTWVSQDPWGDDPYHYGTWTWIGRYGWAWVPGTVWAPAWVTWTYSDDYVGWAPLPPNYSFGYSGYSGRPIVLSSSRYVFVPTNRFVGTNVRSVRVSPQRSMTIFRQTTPMTRFGVTGGIVRNIALPMDRIQRVTRTRIETRDIRTGRPITGWSRDSRRQVVLVAPAPDVRAAIAGRPSKGRNRENVPGYTGGPGYTGNGRGNRRPETQQQAPPPQPAPQPVQPNSNGQGYRGRGHRQVEVQQPQVQAAPQPVQPDSNGQGDRGRGHRQSEVQQPQAAPQPVQPNTQGLEKPPKGHGQQKQQGNDKEKGKGKKDNG
ncbi:MAG TPA: DUF6600 domain-containing protein [Thermoanaerobaculia bacterium]